MIDLMIMGILAICLGMIIMVLNYAYDTVEPDLTADFVERNKTVSEEILTSSNTTFPSIFDAAFVFIFVGLWITSLIGSFFLDSHPIFFIISLFILIPILVVMVFLNNFYVETMEITDFITYQTKYPMTYWIGSHIFLISIIIGATIAIALYAKLVDT